MLKSENNHFLIQVMYLILALWHPKRKWKRSDMLCHLWVIWIWDIWDVKSRSHWSRKEHLGGLLFFFWFKKKDYLFWEDWIKYLKSKHNSLWSCCPEETDMRIWRILYQFLSIKNHETVYCTSLLVFCWVSHVRNNCPPTIIVSSSTVQRMGGPYLLTYHLVHFGPIK
jgi:hypothetical protein